MIFGQYKYWLTRRIHLHEVHANGTVEETSICGCNQIAGSYFSHTIDYEKESNLHPYDDLNYCQSCRRKAEKLHGGNYFFLTEKYPNPFSSNIVNSVEDIEPSDKRNFEEV